MAEVTNDSADAVNVTAYDLHFEPGETQSIPDDQADTLGHPFRVAQSPPAVTETVPVADVPSAGPTALELAQQEMDKAQADLARAQTESEGK